jgi:hypothetical protein
VTHPDTWLILDSWAGELIRMGAHLARSADPVVRSIAIRLDEMAVEMDELNDGTESAR